MGDRDIPKPEHAIELSHLIPQFQILIVPGGRGDFLEESAKTPPNNSSSELAAGLIELFLDGPCA